MLFLSGLRLDEFSLEVFFFTLMEEIDGILICPFDVITVFEFNEFIIDLEFKSLVEGAVSYKDKSSNVNCLILDCVAYSKLSSYFWVKSTDLN